MKRLLTLLLCAILLLTLAGCGEAEVVREISNDGHTLTFTEVKKETWDVNNIETDVYAVYFTYTNNSGKASTHGVVTVKAFQGDTALDSIGTVSITEDGVASIYNAVADGASITAVWYFTAADAETPLSFELTLGEETVSFAEPEEGGSTSLAILIQNFTKLNWKQPVMWLVGAVLIYLAIKKEMEPSLLLPMGFGAILVNIPGADAAMEHGPLATLFNAGIANELFPLLLFIGIGAMIDFGPLLSNPKLMIFGAAAQFGIFFTLCLASVFFPEIKDAASIAIIGAADGPTAIAVANALKSNYLGAIMVAAYSYMALVPIIQPPVIKALTTKKERRIRMEYKAANVTKTTRILFPIVTTLIVGLFAPNAVSLVGFLMFGNLLRECGVLDSLSETAQKVLANLITLFLGITIAFQMQADSFLKVDTLLIMGLGLVAFIVDTAGGVLFAKLLNLFSKKKINPMIGAAGISAFPMSGRIVHKMGLEEDPQNFLLMHSIGVNVSGQVASVIAGGLILNFFL
ncbi:MAG: sodium ion-translocating decarboxylase subunit beta [Clostridia bacterium]|nr:sodium ion-translocating decarboxylase subunit beta [Clostridia bacterium]